MFLSECEFTKLTNLGIVMLYEEIILYFVNNVAKIKPWYEQRRYKILASPSQGKITDVDLTSYGFG